MSATGTVAGVSAAGDAQDAVGGPAGPPTRTPIVIHDPAKSTDRVGLAFKRAMVAVRKLRGRQTQRPEEISYAQCGLLFGLAHGNPTSARELADQVELTPATVAQMLEHLEAAGLVHRSRSEHDRRVVLSTLTERGAAFVSCRHARMEERWRAMVADFSDAELDATARVLERIAEFFDAMPSDSGVPGDRDISSGDAAD